MADGEKKRKRPRAARACESCRVKKYRCDELSPCSQCKRQKVDCVYDVADHVRQRIFPYSDRADVDTTSQSQSSTILNSSSTAVGPSSASRVSQDGIRHASRVGSLQSQINQAEEDDVEVTDVNQHTQNVEFHGKTSSIAFLTALQPHSPQAATRTGPVPSNTRLTQPSLISVFHNEAFSPESLVTTQQEASALEHERYYFRQAQIFLDGYFQNLHFIHPILDRQVFMNRCEDLWFGKAHLQSKSFIALYYSIMSLGALIKTWDEDKFDGLGRLEWSRKLFNLTRTAIGGLVSMATVESVQCLFFMAKVSQNELNPSLAYLYLGWAIRASCSAGFNRKQISTNSQSKENQDQLSKLWWGLYSLEIEISFALGRPDSLGADAYHNQVMPALDETETAIISIMVPFARIVREVSLSIYLSDDTVHDKALKAMQIEMKMDSWLRSVPSMIRPSILEKSSTPKIMKAPTWVKRQRLVLEVRFYNVKMVLFRPFLTIAARYGYSVPTEIQDAIVKCVDAAKSTIRIMHEMYCHHTFFRTWWYNTTYVLYAASIVLCYGMKVAQSHEKSVCLELGQNAIEILDAMEESTVARNASATIKQIVSSDDGANEAEREAENSGTARSVEEAEDISAPQFAQFADDSFMSFLNLDENLDFFGMTFPLNSSHFPFWNEQADRPP